MFWLIQIFANFDFANFDLLIWALVVVWEVVSLWFDLHFPDN